MKYVEMLNNRVTKILFHKANGVQPMLDSIDKEKDGICGIEYDVVGTKDSVPFLLHDKSLTRNIMSDGHYEDRDESIEVSSLTAKELRELRPDIDTLQEAFEAVQKKGFSKDFEFHLEVKSPDNKLVDNILELLEASPEIDKQTYIRSFQEGVLQRAKEKRPDKSYCLLLSGTKELNDEKSFYTTGSTLVDKLPDVQGIKDICGFKPEQVAVEHNIVTDKFIKNMHKEGIEVEVYTLNDINLLKSRAVDRITTDFPVEISSQINKPQKARL